VNSATVGAIATGVIGVVGGLLNQLVRRPPGLRDEIHADLELWKELPDEVHSKTVLMDHINSRIVHLSTQSDAKSRGWNGVVIGLSFALIIGAGTIFVWNLGHLWRLLAALLALLTLLFAGLGLADLEKTERDEKGNKIQRKPTPVSPEYHEAEND